MDIPSETPLEKQQLNSLGSPSGTFWHRVRFHAVGKIAARFSIDQILDVGAGSGHLGIYVGQKLPGVRYRFVEPIESLDHSLSKRFGEINRVGLSEFAGKKESITCLDVLEHIENDSLFVSELFDKLSSDNYLILTVPAMPMLFSKWDVNLGHFRRYSKSTLRAVFSHTPFKIIECNYIFPELVIPAFFRKYVSRSKSMASAEFPSLPIFFDLLLEAVGVLILKLRRFVPIGSSILLVAVKPRPVHHP